jgi:hypothetical protein
LDDDKIPSELLKLSEDELKQALQSSEEMAVWCKARAEIARQYLLTKIQDDDDAKLSSTSTHNNNNKKKKERKEEEGEETSMKVSINIGSDGALEFGSDGGKVKRDDEEEVFDNNEQQGIEDVYLLARKDMSSVIGLLRGAHKEDADIYMKIIDKVR